MTNSWYGKCESTQNEPLPAALAIADDTHRTLLAVHLEMRWHHSFHFMLWGRPHLAQRADGYFDAVREPAREFTKQRQGYHGVRWVRCVLDS